MPVKIKSTTNTKLALATAALLVASGLALAFIPGSGLGKKCGVNTAKYENNRKCRGGAISSIKFLCHGEKRRAVWRTTKWRTINGRCANYEEYQEEADKKCCELAKDTGECVDTDRGLETRVAGKAMHEVRNFGMVESRTTVEDSCYEGDPNNILEAYCTEDGIAKQIELPCREGFECAETGLGAKCEPLILGCTESTAHNYNPAANTDDESCVCPETQAFNPITGECVGPGFESDDGFNFLEAGFGVDRNGNILQDRCVEDFNFGGGTTDGLIEVECHNEDCYQYFKRGYNCEEGKLGKTAVNRLANNYLFEPTTDKSCFDEDEKIIVSDRFHWNWPHTPNRYGPNNSRLCPEGSICEQRCLDNSDNCVDEEMVASCVPADPENMPECHDVIQNHNNPNEPRINLIFVGLDYHRLYPEDHRRSLQTFLFDTRQLLTAPETGFIENMVISEKYNFWYVDRFLEIPLSEGQELGVVDNYNPDEHYSRWRVGVLSSKELAKTCGFTPNGENVLAVNIGINHGNGDSVISVPGKREVQLFRPDLFNQCKQATPASVEFMDNNNDSCLNSFDFPDFDPNIDQLPNSYSEDFDYNGDGEIEPPSIGRLRSADNSFFRSLIRTSKDISLCYGQNNQDVFENTTEYICGNANVLSSGQLANKLRGVADYQYGILKHETTHNFEIGHARSLRNQNNTEQEILADQQNITVGHCFIADSEEECRANAPWKDMIGNGCGEPGIEDCVEGEDVNFSNEVTCYEGCIYGVKSYRATRTSYMEYGSNIESSRMGADQDSPWLKWYLANVAGPLLDLIEYVPAR